jgi:hypothetical protein
MKTELEQEFFKVFGIEPKIEDGCKYADNYWNNERLANLYGTFDAYLKEKCPYENKECYTICSYCYDKEVYPEITDRKLLEMICILQRFKDITFNNLYFENIEHLKNEVLSQIYKCKLKLHEFNAKQLQRQIQQLFKEEK